MRKKFLLGLAVALFVAVAPAVAQDEEDGAVACTPEDLQTTTEVISAMSAPYQELTAGMDATDPITVSAAVVAFQYMSTGFWTEIYPEIPACAEASTLAYNFGLALDESVISTGIIRLGLFEAEFGDPDLAKSIVEYGQARAEWYAQIIANTFGQISEDGELPDSMYSPELDACTDADYESEGWTALKDSLAAYNELDPSVATATGDELTGLIGSYAQISSEFWASIYPNLPACAEIAETGYNIGLVYNERIITLLLGRLAEYENEHGSEEAATALVEGAQARQELFESFVESAFPQAEATEEAE